GVPAWAARKRTIEDEEERIVNRLLELNDKLAAKKQATAAIELALQTAAHALDLSKLNELVQKHNRYYPVEANLPMDRKTGRYLALGVLAPLCSIGIAHVLTSAGDTSLLHAGFLLATNAIVATCALTGAAIDLEHMILPNELTLGPAILCLVTSPLRSIGIVG